MADQKITTDCRERVAYEMMNSIAYSEGQRKQSQGPDKDKDVRGYLLTLYRQCYKAVTGHELKDILAQD